MKPAAFRYEAPSSLAEALELLGQHGDEGRPLAGGQSLVPMMNLRLARPGVIVDLNGIGELAYHRAGEDALVVGALCRQREIELDGAVAARCAAIGEAVPLIGHVAVRNRGTVLGSLAHADPAAEWPCLALLLDATLLVRSSAGPRRLAAADFFQSVFTTDLRPGEVLVEAEFPWPAAAAGTAFFEVARRHGDFALAAAAALVALGPDGTAREVRVAVAGVDSVPRRLPAAEAALLGGRAGAEAIAEAARAGAAAFAPQADIHGSAEYRRDVGETLVRRALSAAAGRAGRAA